ncbi:hypothetical protein NP233_g12749 [Leucocoprinus birnbaumii]|uniref:Uncharacterized protein n=1 Tax=Leucocoprinus birnbaumii TaxID=56174 RepID=A0AAD5YJ74_9AGAR|nr:hypothetical protein NP233_g12749 [Leucocoprinus birnbaumii]
MQHCLDEFHSLKNVFIKLKAHEHFNIPKLHALLHYIAAIIALGTPDGYNTESPERLHIDFAKVAYRASNCRDYIKQMALWLQQCEAVWVRECYIDWLDNVLAEDQATEEQTEPLEDEEQGISPKDIVKDFGAHNFILALSLFLKSIMPFDVHCSLVLPNAYDCFDAFKQVSILPPSSPYVKSKQTYQTIRAWPSMSSKGRKKGLPTLFDTAFAIEDLNCYTGGHTLTGLRVAQIQLIFNLPLHLGTHYPQPLAHVEWFTQLGAPDPHTGMSCIWQSMKNK